MVRSTEAAVHHPRGDGAARRRVLAQPERVQALVDERGLREHEGEARLASMLKLAKLTQAKVKRAEVQLEIWRTVRTLDPNHAGALEALDDLYRRTQAFAELAEVLRTRIDSDVDPELRCKLLQRLALLFEDQLRSEPDADVRAVEAWRERLDTECRNRAIDRIELTTDEPLDQALLDYLVRRAKAG